MRIERLLTILILLLNRRRVRAPDLADALNVSLRTVYRDMEALSLAGVPIVSYTGGEGGFEIMEHFRLERQMLSYNELVAMHTALRGLETTRAMNHVNLERLLDKVGAMVIRAERGSLADSRHLKVDFTPWKDSAEEENKFGLLRQAVSDRQRIGFVHTDGHGYDSKRRVAPLSLILKGYAWYLQGYCADRQDYRLFKLSRMRQLQVLPETFVPGDIPPAPAETASRSPQPAAPGLALVLSFAATAKTAVVDHFEEREIERQEDGTLLVRTVWPDQPWVVGFLLQFGANVRVAEPASVAARVQAEARKIASLYGLDGEARDASTQEEQAGVGRKS